MQEEKNVIISVKNLSKNYSTLVVLKNINLEVRRGEITPDVGVTPRATIILDD